MSEVCLERWEPADGPVSEKRMMSAMGAEGYEVAVYAYREGTSFPPHEHPQDKCDGVLEGLLRVADGEVV